MHRSRNLWESFVIVLSILGVAFVISMRLQALMPSQRLVSMLFVLAVFLILLLTQGYFWGILASIGGVLIDNFVFAYPYFAFDFISTENFIAAVVMLIVAVVTGTLTQTEYNILAMLSGSVEFPESFLCIRKFVKSNEKTSIFSHFPLAFCALCLYNGFKWYSWRIDSGLCCCCAFRQGRNRQNFRLCRPFYRSGPDRSSRSVH